MRGVKRYKGKIKSIIIGKCKTFPLNEIKAIKITINVIDIDNSYYRDVIITLLKKKPITQVMGLIKKTKH